MTKISNQYSLTNILTADLANSRLGINNVSPTVALDVTGAGRFSGASLIVGSAVAATNVKLFLNGVASKAASIEFQQSGVTQWYLGNGAASEDNNFELYNSNGTMAMKIIKSTNAIAFTGAATFSSSVTAGDIFSTDGTRTNFFGVSTGASIGYVGTTTNHPLGFLTNNTERMRIASSFPTLLIGMSNNVYGEAGRGTVEISGTSTSLLGFNASGVSKGYLYMNGTDIIGQLSTGGAWQFKSNNGGVQLTFNSTAWASISDERLKNINSYINNAVDKLNTLRTINYSWKSDNTKQEFLGLIAQDVDKVFPEVIEKNKKPENIGEVKDETEYLSVKYTELVPVLIKAIQELSAKVSLLENK